jgi:hypothetical protein
MTAVQVRQQLVEALDLDLVGPGKDSPLEAEVLSQRPSAWYLTGFLVPFGAEADQRSDETGTEEVSQGSDTGDSDDGNTPEPAAARKAYFPSSIGLSLLVPAQAKQLQVTARWGDYRRQEVKARQEAVPDGPCPAVAGDGGGRVVWMRTPREEKLILKLPEQTARPEELAVPQSDGLKLALSVRPVQKSKLAGEVIFP